MPMFRKVEDKFDRFTERARKVLSLAQEEMQRFQHNYIGTEHLLLGLVREGEGIAAKVLSQFGITLNNVRDAVQLRVGRGDRMVLGKVGLTPRAQEVIALAVKEAETLNHHFVGTEHLLLGLIGMPESIAVNVLQDLGVTVEEVRAEILRILSQKSGPQSTLILQARGDRQRMKRERERDRFDRFDDDARKVLNLAQEEAQRFQHNYIGTEHLLLGLVGLEESTAARILNRLGVELSKARSAVEFTIGRGDRAVPGEIGLTPRAKKVIQLAVDEARRLGHHYIGTEHILLGLVREGEGIAAGVLDSLGVKMGRLNKTIVDMLAQEEGRPNVPGHDQGLVKLACAYARGEKSAEPRASGVQDADDLVPEPSGEEERGNRFTIRARRVLARSHDEARQYEREIVGTECLLLSLVREQNGIAYHVLRNTGIDIERILAATQFLIVDEKLNEPGEADGLTTDGRKAIELTIDEARQFAQTAIGTEHLLLGLLRSEGIASGVLITRGLTLEKARAEVRRLMGE